MDLINSLKFSAIEFINNSKEQERVTETFISCQFVPLKCICTNIHLIRFYGFSKNLKSPQLDGKPVSKLFTWKICEKINIGMV